MMLNIVPRRFVVLAGLLASSADLGLAQESKPKRDPRLAVLENFFAARHCPIRDLAGDFLLAADKNGLDWRLLPSISFIESGGGKVHRNNNIFGWASGRKKFSSIREAIHTTAGKLAHSKLYRNKDTDQILVTYNPRPAWGERVKAVMRSIGADPPPAVAAAMN